MNSAGNRAQCADVSMAARWLCGLCGLAVSVLPGCGQEITSEQTRRLLEAQQAFDAAETPSEYVEVAARYQALRDEGLVSGSLLYNQGNAYVRAERLPEALAAYRAAQRYRPRDPRLQANLRLVESRLAVEAPRDPFYQYLLFWQDWLSYREKYWLCSVLIGLWLTLALLALWNGQRAVFRLSVVAAALAVLMIASATVDWYRFEALQHGVVRGAETMPRKGDAESYGPAFTEPVTAGTGFTVLDARNGWLLVQFPGGQSGWIRNRQAVLY